MALESATYISGLNASNPSSSDNASQGDDHLRLLKSTILNSFPSITAAVTATHTELNVLDGVTATTAELNILDGVTSTAAELNILDGVTSSAAELNILDGVTATTVELNYVDGVTSSIQTQLDAKLPTAGGTMTGNITFSDASEGLILAYGTRLYDASDTTYVLNLGPTTVLYSIYSNGSGPIYSLSSSGTLTASGLVKGNGGGYGLGAITVSTSAPSGGSDGDLWLRYE